MKLFGGFKNEILPKEKGQTRKKNMIFVLISCTGVSHALGNHPKYHQEWGGWEFPDSQGLGSAEIPAGILSLIAATAPNPSGSRGSARAHPRQSSGGSREK